MRWAAQMRGEDGHLAREHRNGTRDQRLAEPVAGGGNHAAGDQIVGAVEDDLGCAHKSVGIGLGDRLSMQIERHMRIERGGKTAGTLGLA